MSFEFVVHEDEILLFKKRRYVRQSVRNAVAKGEMQKMPHCELCLERCNTQAHHVDYGQPLKVLWLCEKCHGKCHKKRHPLNPKNNRQTPMPQCLSRYKNVTVTFVIPAQNFIALHYEAKKKNTSISKLLRNETLEKFPVRKDQLEFKFEEKNDIAQEKPNQRIQSLDKNEVLLSQPECQLLSKVRRKRDLNLSRMDRELFDFSGGYGSNALELQRSCVNR